MAEDFGQRKDVKKSPWLQIFNGFKVALDLKKLLLAAGGILATALGWWLLAAIFFSARTKPMLNDFTEPQTAFHDFKEARGRWNLLYELAGDPSKPERPDDGDYAVNPEEYKVLHEIDPTVSKTQTQFRKEALSNDKFDHGVVDRVSKYYEHPILRPVGVLRSWPWFEHRGANPYLMVSNSFKQTTFPAESGSILTWFFGEQVPVLLEPLRKFIAPVAYLIGPRAGGWNRLYLILVLLWTLATWAFFGGAITRLAVVQLARGERASLREVLKFTCQRYQSYFLAPVFPLILLAGLTVFLMIFGFVEAYTYFVGDILIAGLLWPLVIIVGLVMAVILVGLVGWPLMYATISAEGSDSFDALSRSYSYVYQAPWQFIWYCFVSLVYGAALVFFVVFMGSLVVYLGKWGVSEAPFISSSNLENDRSPAYLFYYAPTSLGWRDLLLVGSPYAEAVTKETPHGPIVTQELSNDYVASIKWYNRLGAIMVSFWLYLLFLLIIGFGYSYFWTAATIIYLLMRRHVDDTDMDEIYHEDELPDSFPSASSLPPTAPVPPAPSAAPTPNVTMVDAPTLRMSPSELQTPPSPPPSSSPGPTPPI